MRSFLTCNIVLFTAQFSLFDHRGPSPSFTATAGFSVGEFAALVFGRAMSLGDGILENNLGVLYISLVSDTKQ